MFDLEQSIADWRRQMLAAGIKAPAPLDELETHLRDETEQQIKSGSNEQQAFAIAVQRIGQGHVLKNEFKKVSWIGQTPFWPVMFALSAFAFLVAALFFPLFLGIAFIFVVTASVWEISPLITFVSIVAISVFIFLPILRPRVKSWLLPFVFGLVVLVSAAGAFVYDLLGDFDDIYFHPYGLILLAIGASLCLGEGLAVKSRRQLLATSVS
jgi:hypothetical protein